MINNEGIPLKSTLDSSTTVQYGGMISDLGKTSLMPLFRFNSRRCKVEEAQIQLDLIIHSLFGSICASLLDTTLSFLFCILSLFQKDIVNDVSP